MIVRVLAALLALAVLGLADAGHAQPKTLTLRVGDQVGSELDYGPFWIAVEKGYLKEEGITHTRKTYINGPNTLLDFNKGELDMVMAGLGPFMQAAAQGADFVMITSITKGNAPLIARPEIKSPRDLNGQKVGSPGLGTIQDTMLSLYEKEHGIKVEHVPTKITDLIAMLEKRDVVAFTGWETVAATTVLKVKGAHYLAPLPVLPNAESLEVIVSRKLAQSDPNAVLGLTRALLKGMRYYERFEEDALRIIAKAMNVPDALEIAKLAKGQIKITDPYIDQKSSQIIFQALLDTRKILPDKLPSFDDFTKRFVDYSFLRKAEESLKGWEPKR
ncbi:MAG TPA: ABC transporter substrate-binding protein [Methylomirabilota bacterium]|nr:ABC transporter substrate-binding protein [Methylomirabilota bacterium]